MPSPADIQAREDLALEMAAQPEGVTSRRLAAALGMSMFIGKAIVAALLQSKRLRMMPGKTKGTVYFRTPEQAEAALAQRMERKREWQRQHEANLRRLRDAKPKRRERPRKAETDVAPKPATAAAAEFALLPAIETPQTKRVSVPFPADQRWVSAVVPRAVNPAECSAWAAAVAAQIERGGNEAA